MGYYSDVAITLFKQDFDELCKQVSERGRDSDAWRVFEQAEIDICDNHDPAKSIVTMIWISIKWYDSFEGVAFFMNFLRSAEPERRYSFKRIGEEYDDIEIESNDYEYELSTVYINRSFDREIVGESFNASDFLSENSTDAESIDYGMSYEDIMLSQRNNQGEHDGASRDYGV